MLKYFADEKEAKELALVDLQKLLSNKTYINPDNFRNLKKTYSRQQLKFDTEITTGIKSITESMTITEEVLKDRKKNIQDLKQTFQNLKESWQKDAKFHNEMILYEKIITFQKNIKSALDYLDQFRNLSKQIQQLEEVYKDPIYFDYIQNQLSFLKELRNAAVEKLNTSGNKGLMNKFLLEFSNLDEFEQKFYDYIYSEILGNCLAWAKKKPRLIIKALKMLYSADKQLESEQKVPYFVAKSRNAIERSIDQRFNDKFSKAADIADVIKDVDFTVKDLFIVIENVAPCFPQEYGIVQLYERKYKENVERFVLPYLDNKMDIIKDPGFLISLVSWLDEYEDVLGKIGVKENDYVKLKIKAKEFLPELYDHLEKFMNESLLNIIKEERSLYSPVEIEKLVNQGAEISSNFAQDIFMVINRQLEIVGSKTRGEVFMEIIRLWTTNLAEFQKQEKNTLVKTVSANERMRIIIYINNYYKCLQNISFTQDEAQKHAPEELHDRLDTIFSDLKKAFAESCQELLVTYVELYFTEIEVGAIVYLFRQNWVDEDVTEIALDMMKNELTGLNRWLLSPLHYSRTVRLSLERFTDLYFERFLYTIQKAFSVIKAFEPTKRKIALEGEMKDEERSSRPGSKIILQNKKQTLELMERDFNTIVAFSKKKDYENIINASFLQKIKLQFDVIRDLFSVQKSEFTELFDRIHENFKENGIHVLKAVISAREDCEEKDKKDMEKYYNSYFGS